MKKKFKLFCTIATLCLSLAMFTFGVFSALTVTYKTTGTLTYDIEDTYVEIETRVYSTSKKFDDKESLKTQSLEIEGSTFALLNNLTTTGLTAGENTYDFNKVQIKNLGQDEDYVVQDSDYVDTYSSVTATEAPSPLELSLSYTTTKDDSQGIYTYFVVTKIINKSSLPLYAYVPTTGEDAFVAPDNSHTYKLLQNYKELSTLDSEVYIVFAMSLDDITVSITESQFVFPIIVTKDLTAIPDNDSVIASGPNIANITASKEEVESPTISLSSTPISNNLSLTLFDSVEYTILNFVSNDNTQTASLMNKSVYNSTTATTITISMAFILSADGQVMDYTSYMSNFLSGGLVVSGKATSPDGLTEDSIISTATFDINSEKTAYELTLPVDKGFYEFSLFLIFKEGCSELLASASATFAASISTTYDNLQIYSGEDNYNWEEAYHKEIGTDFSNNLDIISGTISDTTMFYGFTNYKVSNISADKEALEFSLNAIDGCMGAMALEGPRVELALSTILTAAENKSFLSQGTISDERIDFNIPLYLIDGEMSFCIVFVFDDSITEEKQISLQAYSNYANVIPISYILKTASDGSQYYSVERRNSKLLTEIEIPETYNGLPVKEIEEKAFYNNENITKVELPNTITKIGDFAFRYCSILSDINIPTNLEYIGEYAFANIGITSLVIPTTVSFMGYACFAYCPLTSITIPFVSETEFDESPLDHLFEADWGMIPESLKTVTITGKGSTIVSSFGSFAGGIENIIIGEGCIGLGGYEVFSANSSLVNLSLPNSLKFIEEDIFGAYNSPQNLVLNTYDNAQYIGNSTNPYLVLIKATSKDITSCTIHEDTKFLCGTTYSSFVSFSGCTNLKTVSIPDGIIGIGGNPFYECNALEFYTYDNATYLGNSTNNYVLLYSATSKDITSCTIHPNTKIIFGYGNGGAFYECSNLAAISIPNKVTYIGSLAFGSCSKASLMFEENSQLTYIGSSAFDRCAALTSLVLPDSVIYLDDNAFGNITNLANLKLSENLVYIGGSAFQDNKSLTFVELPNSLRYIGSYAFYMFSGVDSYSRITTLVINSITPPFSTNNSFQNTFTAIYVPDESVDLYKNAEGWSSYASVILPMSQKPA